MAKHKSKKQTVHSFFEIAIIFAMKTFFVKKRRSSSIFQQKKKKKSIKKWFFCGGIILLFLFLLPLFRLLFGPFGFFAWHSFSFFNSRTLLLFQNEAEIRPTGGFISAIGVLDIHFGKPSLTILDSYSIAAPSEKIPAPKALETIFSQDPKYAGWTFRDANFSPDFPTSVTNILHFLQYDKRFSEKKIEGVVALNFSVIEDLLKQFPLDNTITSKNAFLTFQRATKNIDLHSAKDLKNRKNILQETAHTLLSKIGYFGLPKAVKVIAHSADNREVQFWFLSKSLQKKIEKKGWSGKIINPVFSVNIANLGAKKSNRYIFPEYFSAFSIDGMGKMKENFFATFFHAGGKNLLSDEGNYFVRILRPLGTKLVSGDFTHTTVSEKYEEFSKIIFLKPGEKQELFAKFSLPDIWKNGKKNFVFLKQSGENATLSLSFTAAGESLFSSSSCDAYENVLHCILPLTENRTISAELLRDTFPPLLENAFLDTPNEIFMRFSEPVLSTFEPEKFSLLCKNTKIAAIKLLRGTEEMRDVRVVLEKNLPNNGEFCEMKLEGVSDFFGNRKDIFMTLPLRY